MNVWTLGAPNRLVKETQQNPEPGEGELKVRITKVLVNGLDAMIHDGSIRVTYPLIPGRFAVGRVVSENGPIGLQKGTRVLMHTFRPCKDTGTQKKDFSADDYGICGQTADGFLRDFVCVGQDELIAIPDTVSDESALLVELVALAKATVELLDVQKGQHIAVFGGDMLGNFICQLLIYQQASPVLIDNHTKRLDFAKKCGIYYTSFSDDTLVDEVAKITGGRLAEGAIYVTSAGLQDKALPFKVSARATSAVFTGFHGHDLTVNINNALKKQITVYGVTNGSDYIPTAINLLANKAIDLSQFAVNAFDANKISAELEKIAHNPTGDISALSIAELI